MMKFIKIFEIEGLSSKGNVLLMTLSHQLIRIAWDGVKIHSTTDLSTPSQALDDD
jgi:hypothetical protein